MKIAIVGDMGVGKTTFIQKLTSGTFKKTYKPSTEIATCDYVQKSSIGDINITFVVFPGNKNIETLEDIEGVIIFCDITNAVSYRNAYRWKRSVEKIDSTIPIALFVNKYDCPPAEHVKRVNFKSPFFKISVRVDNLQIELLNVLKKFLKNEDIDIRFNIIEKEKLNKQLIERLEGDCPVCFDKICTPVLLPCEHVFCKNCVIEWIKINSSCPLCRHRV